MSTIMPSDLGPVYYFRTGSGHGPCPAACALGTNHPPLNPTTAKHPKPVVDGGRANASAQNAESSDQLHVDVDGVLLTNPVPSDDDDENIKPDPRPNFQNPGSRPLATSLPAPDLPTRRLNSRIFVSRGPIPQPNSRLCVPRSWSNATSKKRATTCANCFLILSVTTPYKTCAAVLDETVLKLVLPSKPWTSTDLLHAVMLEFDAATNMGEHVEMTQKEQKNS
ncbi:hypothetical protein PSHT_01304 [Puccinia striiformis]|uniref:Uncharacterized protein n=1 Tax=Puccinia striiformis TaxID=27350 RepID=A0A2S4WKS9_9BASI|nr:hypothetical protein PSHT_01304 [Puccinia striiformis]